MKDFSTLEKALGVEFDDKDLLSQAFVHRSYLNENPHFSVTHNERLEFLGDAVLELIVTDYLYKNYPDKPEGELTSWRAALVNSRMLAEVARDMSLNDYLLLSKGESKEVGKSRDYILADTVESFVGSLYLDQGLHVCEKVVHEYIISKLPKVLKEKLFQDKKSRFQELAQERSSITPTYSVIREWGPDHAKQFEIGVYLNDEMVATGQGYSKHEAEEEAAKAAIMAKGWEEDF